MQINHFNEDERNAINDRSDAKPNKDDLLNLTVLDELPENLRQIFLSINIKKPKSSYFFYVSEMMAKENVATMKEANKIYPDKWRKLSVDEKKKYQELVKLDKQRYLEHIELVKKHLIKLPLNQGPTGFSVYLEENVKKAIENNRDPSEAKKEAAAKWEEMSKREKRKYDKKRNHQEEVYRNLKYSWRSINHYSFFCAFQMRKARKKGRKLKISDASILWRKLKQEEKDKYIRFLEAIQKEKAKLKILYKKSCKFKLRKPFSAYNLFCKEFKKNANFNNSSFLKEVSKKWNELNEEQKEKYQRYAKLDQIIYKTKKIEYEKALKKPAQNHDETSAFILFCEESIYQRFPKIGNEGYFEYFYNKWKKLNFRFKTYYKEKAKDKKIEAKTNKEEMHELAYELPKKPINQYQIYVKMTLPKLKNENPEQDCPYFLKVLGENWRNMPPKEKEEYEKLSKKSHELYNSQLKEYHQNGYFTSLENKKKNSSYSINDQVTKNTKKGKKSDKE
jgi:hypothetical protein